MEKQSVFSDLKDYGKRHYKLILLSIVTAVLCFGVNAFTPNIRIDTEELINEPGTTLGWLKIGRFGMVLLKRMLGLSTHNIVLSGLLFFVFFVLGSQLICFGMYYFSGKNAKYPYWMFLVLYLSSCIWNYQFYFSLQQAEVALAMCLTAAAAFLSMHAFFRGGMHGAFGWRRGAELLASAGFLVVGFGSYQALVTYYVAICISYFLIILFTGAEQKRVEKTGVYLFKVAGILLHFGIAYVIYHWIAKTWFMTTGYMENQVVWGSIGPVQCIKNIIKDVLHVLQNQGAENTSFYAAALLLACISIVGLAGKKIFPGRDSFALYILTLSGLFVSPFVMTIYVGVRPVTRTQFALPVMTGVLAVFLFYALREHKVLPGWVLKYAGGGLFALTVLMQVVYDGRLQYTDYVRQQEDVQKTEEILSALRDAGNGEIPKVPVVFVGSRKAELNGLCHRSEMYGWSFYEWDYSTAAPTGATHRISGFIQAYGKEKLNQELNSVLTDAAVEQAGHMGSFPEKGSIEISEDMVVVKLSEIE